MPRASLVCAALHDVRACMTRLLGTSHSGHRSLTIATGTLTSKSCKLFVFLKYALISRVDG